MPACISAQDNFQKPGLYIVTNKGITPYQQFKLPPENPFPMLRIPLQVLLLPGMNLFGSKGGSETKQAKDSAASLSPLSTEQRVAALMSDEANDDLVAEARQETVDNPKDPKAWIHLGNILKERHAEAIAAYKRAIDLDPSFATAFVCLGRVNNVKGNYSEALGYLEKAKNLAQSRPLASHENKELYFQLALAYYKSGNHKKAEEARIKSDFPADLFLEEVKKP